MLALVGALSGCSYHEDELAAVQVALDRELAEKQEIAQNLNQWRREMDQFQQQLVDAEAALSGSVDAGAPVWVMPSTPPRVTPPMPPPSWLEGSGGERRRAQIDDTRRRIHELEKVIGEVNNLEKRRREVKARLEQLDALRKQREAAPPPK